MMFIAKNLLQKPWMMPFCQKAVNDSGKVVQIGSQRRSGPNYQQLTIIFRRKIGKICAVEMTWNVNQPGRWRRPAKLQLSKNQIPTGQDF